MAVQRRVVGIPASIYGMFIGGLDTVDLREAKKLLEELGWGYSRSACIDDCSARVRSPHNLEKSVGPYIACKPTFAVNYQIAAPGQLRQFSVLAGRSRPLQNQTRSGGKPK